MTEDLVTRPVGDDPAGVDDDQPVEDREHVVAVRGDDQGLIGCDRSLEMLDEVKFGLGVHRAARLIEKQQLARRHQRPGEDQ